MKIAIKLPDRLDHRILTFPFLHSLKRFLDKQLDQMDEEESYEIHLIANEEHIDVLNLLPFEAFYHEMSKEDLKSVFSVHRAVVNSKMEGIDTYISMTESFVDASIGKNLKAPRTIGFNTGKNKFLFNAKIPYLKGQHQSDIYFHLLRGICENELPVVPDVSSRELNPFYDDWSVNPYTLINLDVIEGVINSEWIEFFDLFHGQSFVLMCEKLDENYQKAKIEDFIKELDGKNEFRIFEYTSNIDFSKIVAFAQTFITFDSSLVHLASYVGAHTFWLSQKNSRNTFPIYSVGEIRCFKLNEPQYQETRKINYAPIYDEIYDFIYSKRVIAESDSNEDNGTK